MASPLKRLAKQSLAGAKKQVRLRPLSPEDATAVVFTVLNASPAPLLRAVSASKSVKGLPGGAANTFREIILSTLNVRKGSVYAAIVTAIDQRNVFHTDRFAVSLKRLGIMDDIGSKLSANGFGAAATLVANKAPFWWAEMAARELNNVKKEMSASMGKILHKHTEELSTDDINILIENQLSEMPMNTLPGRLQFLHGASQTDMAANQSQFKNLTRSIASKPNIVVLGDSSSFSASFESFYQHLLMNTTAIQRLMPRASFGGKSVSPTQLQRIFRDPQVAKRFRLAFEQAYQRSMHAVVLNTLYQTIKRNNLPTEIYRAAKTQGNMRLTDDAISGITSSVIGLFSAFAGDSKGQSFPMIASFKKG